MPFFWYLFKRFFLLIIKIKFLQKIEQLKKFEINDHENPRKFKKLN